MKLSICSTAFFSEAYLNKNLKLTDLANVDFEWIVADNTMHSDKPPLTNETLDDRFTVIDGVSRNSIKAIDGVGINSFQHGLSLNKCLNKVDRSSDYILLLDPDFFIIPKIEDVLQYIQNNGLHIFGASYMSDTPLLYNYPVGFCMFIDLHHIPIDTINMEPGYRGFYNKEIYPDVGYSFYKRHIDMGTPYDIAMPSVPTGNKHYNHTKESIKSVYGIEYDNPVNLKGTKIDEYFWKNNSEAFAVHLRAKLDKKYNFDVNRVVRQMHTIDMLFDRIKKCQKKS